MSQWNLVIALLGMSAVGCASYQNQMQGPMDLIRQGKAKEAAEKIQPKAEEEGNDQIAYLFEWGTALQLAKDFKASNDVLLKAEDLTAIKDYHSISRIGGSILLNEGLMQYKGEDYEKVFLNALLGINYLMLKDQENAQVEMRKLNEKLYKYKFEAKRDYEQNPFAFYLSGMIWEGQKQWDDAYIDYKHAYEVNPSLDYLKQDLLRLAKLAHQPDDFEKWRKTFDTKLVDSKGKGEVVLIFQQGWAPRKAPHPEFPRIPKLYPVSSRSPFAVLVLPNGVREKTQLVSSIKDVAIKTLDDEYAGLVAKRVAGVAAKAVVSDQLRQKNELLGFLAWLGMNLADRADLRQWVTLPESFQVARTFVPVGKYRIFAEGLNWDGQPSGERSEDFDVEITKPLQKVFLSWRSVQ